MIRYLDFDLELTDWARDDAGGEAMLVRVSASPAGEQRRAEATRVTLDAGVREVCRRLTRRELDLAALVALGKTLGELLLPAPARAYYERSRAGLDESEGLRLRLKLDTWGAADLPWELAWLPPGAAATAADAADLTGFLALDKRLSIVRYEQLDVPLGRLDPVAEGKLRLVALLAAPTDPQWPALNLAGEADGLRDALASRPEVELDLRQKGTLAELEQGLLSGAHIFHFAGHGRFEATMGERIGSVEGKGFLVLCDERGGAAEVAADTLVINLRDQGVRLAVLSACEGARRDGVNPWTGIAPALARGRLPAVVAMQATLRDTSAVAFSARFYEVLARGETVDAAMRAGRLAIFNAGGVQERDWAMPVLYLRAESGVLFPAPDPSGPLGVRGWTNVVLTTAAAATAVAAGYLFAQPRVSDTVLGGGGISVAILVALALLRSLVGDDIRAWGRRNLRRKGVSPALAVTLAGLLVTTWAVHHFRPVVLRVVPGTCLARRLGNPAAEFILRVWQGDSRAAPAWELPELRAPGAALGAPRRVTELALKRATAGIEERMNAYLTRNQVSVGDHEGWRVEWELSSRDAASYGNRRRRAQADLRYELWKCPMPRENAPPRAPFTGCHQVPVKGVELRGIGNAVQIVFLEPETWPNC